MLAMTYRGPYRVRIMDKPEPQIEHPGDAIVRLTRACICGSDLHLYHGLVPDTRAGQTFGHEFVGVIEEVGAEVESLKPGDRVLIPFNIFCGQCYFCKKGLYGNCHNTNPNATAAGGIYGYSHTTGGYDGGQAEYVRVPFAQAAAMPIPDEVDDDNAARVSDRSEAQPERRHHDCRDRRFGHRRVDARHAIPASRLTSLTCRGT